jgi:hypothetical protein
MAFVPDNGRKWSGHMAPSPDHAAHGQPVLYNTVPIYNRHMQHIYLPKALAISAALGTWLIWLA